MSLRQIARQLSITPAYLSYMVNGKRPWRADLYDRYCQLVIKSVNNNGSSVNSRVDVQITHFATNLGGSGRESNPPPRWKHRGRTDLKSAEPTGTHPLP